ncbi:Putative transport protein [Salmonella enterica subsp. diarizonae]|nr:Putative transport protein [Salmonella enterica subsp. diarizonae]
MLAALPPIIQVLVFNGFYDALLVLAGYLLINLVFGNILEPRIMGRGLGLSTLVVFLSLIFWGWLLGPVGMLLSVPLTIIVKSPWNRPLAGRVSPFCLAI